MPITLDGTNGITQSASFKSNTYLDAAGGNTATINGAVPATAASPALTGIPTAPTAAVATNTTQIATTAFVSSNLGVTENENRIINGSFDFWQRGTSFTASAYGADRWINGVSGGTVTMSQQAFTVGDTRGSNNPTFFARQTVSGQTLSSNLALIQQRFEGVRTYAGQTITVLGYARRSSGSGNMAVEMAQTFGTGGSPSADVTGTGQTVTLTGSFASFAVTIAVPSITGKTIGTGGNDYSNLNFWPSAGSAYNARTNSLGLQTIGVDLWGVHIKLGTHTAAEADLYKQPEMGPELARCQRYYQTLATNISGDTCVSSGTARAAWFFKVNMRTTPTLSFAQEASSVEMARVVVTSGVPAVPGGSTADAEL